jgi:hypothetical protein
MGLRQMLPWQIKSTFFMFIPLYKPFLTSKSSDFSISFFGKVVITLRFST